MKFEIKNRWTGAVQVTAEIECEEGAEHSIKLGLAVKWAYKEGANLDGANLYGANLYGAYRGQNQPPIPGWHTLASGYLERDA